MKESSAASDLRCLNADLSTLREVFWRWLMPAFALFVAQVRREVQSELPSTGIGGIVEQATAAAGVPDRPYELNNGL
jgi:hypothetical protein